MKGFEAWDRVLAAVAADLPARAGGAGERNAWRGPQRNGAAAASPSLLEAWPTHGPRKWG